MSINTICIDFVCPCGKTIIAMPLRDVYYAAGKPCCCHECQQAELVKLAHQAFDGLRRIALEFHDKEATAQQA